MYIIFITPYDTSYGDMKMSNIIMKHKKKFINYYFFALTFLGNTVGFLGFFVNTVGFVGFLDNIVGFLGFLDNTVGFLYFREL